jgi:hypothetical protein
MAVMYEKRHLLEVELKPTASGLKKRSVGGEVVGTNLIQLLTANLLWIVVLAAPLIITYALVKRGIRIPAPFRSVLRFLPLVRRA